MEKAKRISQGIVDTMYALSSFFIDNSAHIHCAARVVDLNSLAQFIILYSLRHSQQNSMRTKKHGKQQLSLACEEPAQQTETTALSMQVNLPHRLHLPVMYPPLQSILRHLLPFPDLVRHRRRAYLLGHQVQAEFLSVKVSSCSRSSIPTYLFWWCP